MDVFPGSTIAALCYARDIEFDFHALATEMSKALWDMEGAGRLDMPDRDFALCDTPDMRIGLARVALSHVFPGSLTGRHYPSCMVLSVGPGETVPEVPEEARYARVRADLVSRVQDIASADRVLMFERAGVYDTDLHDAVVDDIRGHLDKVLCARREPLSDVIQTAPTARAAEDKPVAEAAPFAALSAGTASGRAADLRAVDVTQPDDIIQGLARRLEEELDRLGEARRALEQVGATPDRRRPEPRPMRLVVPRLFPTLPSSALGLFRMPTKDTSKDAAKEEAKEEAYPDYEHMPANVDERPLLHRAAVNALNVTVMTIALPVGAALLTMSVLGREDMLISSRVTAVTGVGVGLYNTGMAERLFALFS